MTQQRPAASSLSRRHFKKGSGVFACHHCRRRTRDTTGDNGDVRLCEDCYDGCMYDNGANDSSDADETANLRRIAAAHFQRAVNKGGVIEGYTPQTFTARAGQTNDFYFTFSIRPAAPHGLSFSIESTWLRARRPKEAHQLVQLMVTRDELLAVRGAINAALTNALQDQPE